MLPLCLPSNSTDMASLGEKETQRAVWSEIVSTARTWHYDRYLAATLAPRHIRHDLIVLAAFAGEIDHILVTLTEPAIAAIRLQWWRDAIGEKGMKATGNPLADTLRETIHRHNLPEHLFIDYIDTQDIELYSDLAPDLDALLKHFIKRDGALFGLATRIFVEAPSSESDLALKAGAQAYGLARTLAELPWRLKARQFLLPADMALQHGFHPGETVELSRAVSLRDALADVARGHLEEYRRDLRSIPPSIRTAVLPIALTGLYLHVASRHHDAAKAFDVKPSHLARAWYMLYAYWSGSI